MINSKGDMHMMMKGVDGWVLDEVGVYGLVEFEVMEGSGRMWGKMYTYGIMWGRKVVSGDVRTDD